METGTGRCGGKSDLAFQSVPRTWGRLHQRAATPSSFYARLTPRLEVFGVEDFVGAVVRHDAVDVVLRLVEADLGGEDAGVFVHGADDPARDVVLAAVVGGGDGFVKVGEHPVQLAEVGRAQKDVNVG